MPERDSLILDTLRNHKQYPVPYARAAHMPERDSLILDTLRNHKQYPVSYARAAHFQKSFSIHALTLYHQGATTGCFNKKEPP